MNIWYFTFGQGKSRDVVPVIANSFEHAAATVTKFGFTAWNFQYTATEFICIKKSKAIEFIESDLIDARK